MQKTERTPDFSLFLDILYTLETINAPYMVIGAFAGALYGISRITYDIDIVVDLTDEHIEALAAAYPLPRYYADSVQMRDSIDLGIMFNIIDTTRGEKADLVPLTMDSRYQQAFQRRIRQVIPISDEESIEISCARPEDVILGKLMAWAEGQSRRHETDIYEIMLWHYLSSLKQTDIDEAYIDAQVQILGQNVVKLWKAIKEGAEREAKNG